jgi:bifunctional DNA-binding transcriptional regulator/antitoxin component of YhaV-PrlF toxin-antitoxin module
MKSSYQLQIGRRGVITFPKELRDQKNITDGEVFTLIELSDDIFILSRQRSRFDAIADQLAKEWEDSGESLETMLSSLKEVRAEYHEKKVSDLS